MERTRTVRVLHLSHVAVPPGLSFQDLKLQRTREGVVLFDYEALRTAWIASGHSPGALNAAGKAQICAFIGIWYAIHVSDGGAADEDLQGIMEYLLDDTRGDRRILPLDLTPL